MRLQLLIFLKLICKDTSSYILALLAQIDKRVGRFFQDFECFVNLFRLYALELPIDTLLELELMTINEFSECSLWHLIDKTFVIEEPDSAST